MTAIDVVDMSVKPYKEMAENAYSYGFPGMAAMLYWNAVKEYVKDLGFETKASRVGTNEEYKKLLDNLDTLEANDIKKWMDKGKTAHQIDEWLLKKYGKCIGKLMS